MYLEYTLQTILILPSAAALLLAICLLSFQLFVVPLHFLPDAVVTRLRKSPSAHPITCSESPLVKSYDFVIVGGTLSSHYRFKRLCTQYPKASILLLEPPLDYRSLIFTFFAGLDLGVGHNVPYFRAYPFYKKTSTQEISQKHHGSDHVTRAVHTFEMLINELARDLAAHDDIAETRVKLPCHRIVEYVCPTSTKDALANRSAFPIHYAALRGSQQLKVLLGVKSLSWLGHTRDNRLAVQIGIQNQEQPFVLYVNRELYMFDSINAADTAVEPPIREHQFPVDRDDPDDYSDKDDPAVLHQRFYAFRQAHVDEDSRALWTLDFADQFELADEEDGTSPSVEVLVGFEHATLQKESHGHHHASHDTREFFEAATSFRISSVQRITQGWIGLDIEQKVYGSGEDKAESQHHLMHWGREMIQRVIDSMNADGLTDIHSDTASLATQSSPKLSPHDKDSFNCCGSMMDADWSSDETINQPSIRYSQSSYLIVDNPSLHSTDTMPSYLARIWRLMFENDLNTGHLTDLLMDSKASTIAEKHPFSVKFTKLLQARTCFQRSKNDPTGQNDTAKDDTPAQPYPPSQQHLQQPAVLQIVAEGARSLPMLASRRAFKINDDVCHHFGPTELDDEKESTRHTQSDIVYYGSSNDDSESEQLDESSAECHLIESSDDDSNKATTTEDSCMVVSPEQQQGSDEGSEGNHDAVDTTVSEDNNTEPPTASSCPDSPQKHTLAGDAIEPTEETHVLDSFTEEAGTYTAESLACATDNGSSTEDQAPDTTVTNTSCDDLEHHPNDANIMEETQDHVEDEDVEAHVNNNEMTQKVTTDENSQDKELGDDPTRTVCVAEPNQDQETAECETPVSHHTNDDQSVSTGSQTTADEQDHPTSQPQQSSIHSGDDQVDGQTSTDLVSTPLDNTTSSTEEGWDVDWKSDEEYPEIPSNPLKENIINTPLQADDDAVSQQKHPLDDASPQSPDDLKATTNVDNNVSPDGEPEQLDGSDSEKTDPVSEHNWESAEDVDPIDVQVTTDNIHDSANGANDNSDEDATPHGDEQDQPLDADVVDTSLAVNGSDDTAEEIQNTPAASDKDEPQAETLVQPAMDDQISKANDDTMRNSNEMETNDDSDAAPGTDDELRVEHAQTQDTESKKMDGEEEEHQQQPLSATKKKKRSKKSKK